MSRFLAGQIMLAASIFCAACGSGSKDVKATPSPVAAAEPPATEPYATTTPEAGQSQAQSMDVPSDPDRQPVSGREGPIPTTGTEGTVTPTEATPAGLGQPTIFAMLNAASQGEIDLAKLALQKSKNKEVKRLAQGIIDDHQKMLADGERTAQKLSVTPMVNDEVKTMTSDATATKERLQGLSGKEFDRAFADQMVTDHNKALDLIDSKFAPAATGVSDLNTMLDDARAKIQGHLVAAKGLRDKL